MPKVKPDAERVLHALGYRFAVDDESSGFSVGRAVERRRASVASTEPDDLDDDYQTEETDDAARD